MVEVFEIEIIKEVPFEMMYDFPTTLERNNYFKLLLKEIKEKTKLERRPLS